MTLLLSRNTNAWSAVAVMPNACILATVDASHQLQHLCK